MRSFLIGQPYFLWEMRLILVSVLLLAFECTIAVPEDATADDVATIAEWKANLEAMDPEELQATQVWIDDQAEKVPLEDNRDSVDWIALLRWQQDTLNEVLEQRNLASRQEATVIPNIGRKAKVSEEYLNKPKRD